MDRMKRTADDGELRGGSYRGQDQRGERPPEPAGRCLAVMYHYVHDREPNRSVATGGIRGLSVAEFNAQLDRLCAVLEPVDWPAVYAATCGKRSLPSRCFLLTFDDGLADHAAFVQPVLESRGLRGVFFVPGVVLTQSLLLPAHAIHILLSSLSDEQFEREVLDYVQVHGGGRTGAPTVDMDAARSLYHYEPSERARLKYLLTVVLPAPLRDAALESLFREHIGSPARWARHWYLGWDDLVRTERAGHTVGAHGFSHEPLTLMSPAKRREDAARAAEVLRSGLGPDIRPFSYPYGRFDADTCAACQAAGFAHAFTTEQGWIGPGSDVFRLPRVDTISVEAVLDEKMACGRA